MDEREALPNVAFVLDANKHAVGTAELIDDTLVIAFTDDRINAWIPSAAHRLTINVREVSRGQSPAV